MSAVVVVICASMARLGLAVEALDPHLAVAPLAQAVRFEPGDRELQRVGRRPALQGFGLCAGQASISETTPLACRRSRRSASVRASLGGGLRLLVLFQRLADAGLPRLQLLALDRPLPPLSRRAKRPVAERCPESNALASPSCNRSPCDSISARRSPARTSRPTVMSDRRSRGRRPARLRDGPPCPLPGAPYRSAHKR